jgi:hypothetical protein
VFIEDDPRELGLYTNEVLSPTVNMVARMLRGVDATASLTTVCVAWINQLPYHSSIKKTIGNPPVTIWGTMAPLDQVYFTD